MNVVSHTAVTRSMASLTALRASVGDPATIAGSPSPAPPTAEHSRSSSSARPNNGIREFIRATQDMVARGTDRVGALLGARTPGSVNVCPYPV